MVTRSSGVRALKCVAARHADWHPLIWFDKFSIFRFNHVRRAWMIWSQVGGVENRFAFAVTFPCLSLWLEFSLSRANIVSASSRGHFCRRVVFQVGYEMLWCYLRDDFCDCLFWRPFRRAFAKLSPLGFGFQAGCNQRLKKTLTYGLLMLLSSSGIPLCFAGKRSSCVPPFFTAIRKALHQWQHASELVAFTKVFHLQQSANGIPTFSNMIPICRRLRNSATNGECSIAMLVLPHHKGGL